MSKRKPKVIKVLETLGVDSRKYVYVNLNECEKAHIKLRYKNLLKEKNKQ